MFIVTIFKKWVGGTWHGRSYFQKRVFEGYSKGKKRAHPQPQIQRRAPVAKKPVLEDSDSDEENVSDESLDSD